MTPKTTRRAKTRTFPIAVSPGGSQPAAAKGFSATRSRTPQDSTSPATKQPATHKPRPSRGTETAGRRQSTGTHSVSAAGSNSRSTERVSLPMDSASSGSNVPDPEANTAATPRVGSLLDPALALAADVLDDIERVRIANENRLRQMTRSVEDADGEERGFGLDESHPDVARLAAMVATLKAVEHDATLNLQRHMRRHPLGAWMKAQRGIGEKQGARLLAAIGDPYWRPELVYLDEAGTLVRKVPAGPRTVSALWAYCGLHVLPVDHTPPVAHPSGVDRNRGTDLTRSGDQSTPVGVAAKRRKGQRANWSTKAKTRAHLIAESCIKQLSPDCRDGHMPDDAQCGVAVPAHNPQAEDGQDARLAQSSVAVPACACSPYRVVYDQRRAHTASTHPDWTDGHSHNDALRIASKEILKHLWRAARDWHQQQAEAAGR